MKQQSQSFLVDMVNLTVSIFYAVNLYESEINMSK